MSDQTIVALYDDVAAARRVLDDLTAAGFARSDFSLAGGAASVETGYESTRFGTFGNDFTTPANRVSGLIRLGVPEDDAQVYAEGVRRGGALLVGVVDDDDCQRALDIIERHGPADIEERSRLYRESGWTGYYDATTTDYDDMQAAEERSRYSATGLSAAATGMRAVDEGRSDVTPGREERIPVAEENLEIGKRQVERGGVRVRSYVVETPVEETVNLRDEEVSVERRAASPDRPASDADFTERTVEVTETDEVPVVRKEAHVTEEVVIRKDVEERAETVRDNVRRTEVDIEDDRADRPDDLSKRSDI